ERWVFFIVPLPDGRAAFLPTPLSDERAAFFLVPLGEAAGFLSVAGWCKNAVYFLMKALASSSVLIARLSASIIPFTTAARCTTRVHKRSDTGRCLLNASGGSFRMRIIFSDLAIFYSSPI